MRPLRTFTALGLTILVAFSAIAQKAPPSAKAQPDVLIFTNGDQLTGHLKRAAAGSVVFNSDMAGELTIPFDKIKELRSAGSFSLLKKGPPSKTNLAGQGQVSVADSNVLVTPAQAAAVTIPTKDVGYIVDTPTYNREVDNRVPFRKGWTGGITAGATFVRSTDSNTVFAGGINLARIVPTVPFLPPHQRMTFNLNETYGTATSKVIPTPAPPLPTSSSTKTSIFHADGEHDWYFTPHLYALANFAFDHNYSQGLDFQQLYGGGIGWTVFDTPRQELDLKGDVHYERQSFFTTSELNLIGSLFAENYRRTLPAKMALTQSINYIPSWNETRAYSAMGQIGIILPTWKRLGVNFNVVDNYLNNPSPGYNKNSFQFVAGLNYAFR